MLVNQATILPVSLLQGTQLNCIVLFSSEIFLITDITNFMLWIRDLCPEGYMIGTGQLICGISRAQTMVISLQYFVPSDFHTIYLLRFLIIAGGLGF